MAAQATRARRDAQVDAQVRPARVASRRRMTESLMLSPSQLGLTARDVADLIAFLRAGS